MQWNWMKDKIISKEFWIYWDKGENNKADYLKNYFPPSHNKVTRSTFVIDP